MASAELALARASLSAALFRADPRPCSRDDIEHFLSLLASAISQCSPAHVQNCKQWALEHLVPSPARTGAFGRYLRALSGSFAVTDASSRPSAKRKRLHILYIVNDILFHTTQRLLDASFSAAIEPYLTALFESASSFSGAPKQIKKLRDLVKLWEEREYYNGDFSRQLEDVVDAAPHRKAEAADAEDDRRANGHSATKPAKEAPFVMPSLHGDPTTPWYDLPAGNWLPVLEPNSTRPMNPSMIKPLQLAAGPAGKDLANAVKKLLADVERIYSYESTVDGDQPADINQLGERTRLDGATGDTVEDTYYGWSREFCDRMKQRKDKARGGMGDGAGGRRRYSDRGSRTRSSSRYRSSSRDSGRPSFKRRRMSSTSRSRSRSQSRKNSRRRGSSRERYRKRPSRSRSRSRTRSRSRSPSRSRSRSRSYSPRLGEHTSPPPDGAHSYVLARPMQTSDSRGRDAMPRPHQTIVNPPFPPPILPQAGFVGFQPHPPPPPPPPPPNYQGPWPPPPPPLLPPQHGTPAQAPFFFGSNQPAFVGGWPPAAPQPIPAPPAPLPPPMAPPQQPPGQSQGQPPYSRAGYGSYQGQGNGRTSYGFERRW